MSTQVLFKQGMDLYHNREFEKAIQFFNDVLAENPEDDRSFPGEGHTVLAGKRRGELDWCGGMVSK